MAIINFLDEAVEFPMRIRIISSIPVFCYMGRDHKSTVFDLESPDREIYISRPKVLGTNDRRGVGMTLCLGYDVELIRCCLVHDGTTATTRTFGRVSCGKILAGNGVRIVFKADIAPRTFEFVLYCNEWLWFRTCEVWIGGL